VNGLLGRVLTFLQSFIVILSLIFIIIGAFMYITSGGESGRIETAKKCITAALIGLAIGIAAPAFLRQISEILGWTGPDAALPAGVGTSLTLIEIATNVLNFLLSIVGVVALIMLVVGAFMYLTAAGEEDRIDTGKSIVKYSIIGIAVALAALVLVRQVASFF
jgi:glucose uptake protein GlcU